jgi:DNA repair exonuclease SbcCD ATPase subunit
MDTPSQLATRDAEIADLKKMLQIQYVLKDGYCNCIEELDDRIKKLNDELQAKDEKLKTTSLQRDNTALALIAAIRRRNDKIAKLEEQLQSQREDKAKSIEQSQQDYEHLYDQMRHMQKLMNDRRLKSFEKDFHIWDYMTQNLKLKEQIVLLGGIVDETIESSGEAEATSETSDISSCKGVTEMTEKTEGSARPAYHPHYTSLRNPWRPE